MMNSYSSFKTPPGHDLLQDAFPNYWVKVAVNLRHVVGHLTKMVFLCQHRKAGMQDVPVHCWSPPLALPGANVHPNVAAPKSHVPTPPYPQ